MKEAFEEFASNRVWFWITTIVIAIAVGYIVNLYLNFTWALIHAVVMLLFGSLVYAIAKPKER